MIFKELNLHLLLPFPIASESFSWHGDYPIGNRPYLCGVGCRGWYLLLMSNSNDLV